jgi:ornithine decarboxylase
LIDPGVGGAEWPLSRKFGCSIDMAIDILKYAKNNNLIPYGVSFHVGSQQRNEYAWYFALLEVQTLFEKLKIYNINLSMINLGGGLPINYKELANSTEFYLSKIKEFIHKLFEKNI